MRERYSPNAVLAMLCVAFNGCQPSAVHVEPSIEFTRIPPAGEGSPNIVNTVEGRVNGARPGYRIVLFARSGMWWVQPTAEQPFTLIQMDSKWTSLIHPGSAYAALLVKPGYRPPTTAVALPEKGGAIVAVAMAEGTRLKRPVVRTIRFSGYEWVPRQVPGNRNGRRNAYDPANAWTDDKGYLHLRIGRKENDWTSAEVSLSRSLGYGSYRFVVREISHLEPSAAFSIFTSDESAPAREVDLEISRWGEINSKNAQYAIQPYFVPANVIRFMAPKGILSHSINWELGRISFRSARGSSPRAGSNVVAEHSFTSGVPSPGKESVHINFCVYDSKSNPLRHGSEVIIENFEYLP
ncbi:MAG: hypothetical protein H7Y20_09240 [Bryobacteraceae bacterium]|nr:hypothetical protein [Bryobacteraceae bacterium]